MPFPSPMHESEKVKVKAVSCVQLFETPWAVAYQAPLSMGFSRQEYWSGVPLPSSLVKTLFLDYVLLTLLPFIFESFSSEKAMATHSNTLAWKIPWTEEPGRLQSMGSLRVRHD